MKVIFLMPVYRDWALAAGVAMALDKELADVPVRGEILLVDDGSPEGRAGWIDVKPRHLERIRVLPMRRNLGHQRAIAAGLCHIHEHEQADYVLVMDADGEDRPADAIELLGHAQKRQGYVVFAERRKRMEGLVFRSGYVVFRLLHRILTGISVRVGNFSILPFSTLSRLVCMTELWNHYAGAVFKSKLRFVAEPTDRGARLMGQSHMNFVALVVHGISGIATFFDVAAARILIVALLANVVLIAAALGVLLIRVNSDMAIPGWATNTMGILFVVLVQIVGLSFVLLFNVIMSRFQSQVLPERDYRYFVDRTEVLWEPSK